jgi:UDP-sulfoquinovose synthase
VENPRVELEEHYYNPSHTGLLELGLKPHYLTEDVLARMLAFVIKYKNNIKSDNFFRRVKWA